MLPNGNWDFNPITYYILIFRQLWGRLFGPDPENKTNVNWLIWNLVLVMVFIKLVSMQKSIAFMLLKICRHKNYPQNRMSHRDIYPLESSKIGEKSLSMLENIFFGTNLYSLCISLFFIWNKKYIFSVVQNVSFQNSCNICLPPPPRWWIDFVRILPKCN